MTTTKLKVAILLLVLAHGTESQGALTFDISTGRTAATARRVNSAKLTTDDETNIESARPIEGHRARGNDGPYKRNDGGYHEL